MAKYKLSISIMAHESRRENFAHLFEKLGGDTPMALDKIGEEIGVWENCKRAWLAFDPKADFHVVIQDDAQICEDFKERAEAFIEYRYKDKRAFNFFYGNRTGTRKAEIAEGMHTGKIIIKRNSWGVAICVPTKTIPAMIDYCDRLKNIKQDDVRIGRFLYMFGFDVCYPMPSLIDHKPMKSLVGNRDPEHTRQAFWFIGGDPAKIK